MATFHSNEFHAEAIYSQFDEPLRPWSWRPNLASTELDAMQAAMDFSTAHPEATTRVLRGNPYHGGTIILAEFRCGKAIL
jgi:hypothetical protein